MAKHVRLNSKDAGKLAAVYLDYKRRRGDGVGSREDRAPFIRLPNQTFQVKVTIDGGFAGANQSADCTWTYTVTNLRGDVTFGEELTPDLYRMPLTEYLETPDESIGQGYFNEDGEFRLFDANEVPAECDEPTDTTLDGGGP